MATKQRLVDRLRVILAGRAAEEVSHPAFNPHSPKMFLQTDATAVPSKVALP